MGVECQRPVRSRLNQIARAGELEFAGGAHMRMMQTCPTEIDRSEHCPTITGITAGFAHSGLVDTEGGIWMFGDQSECALPRISSECAGQLVHAFIWGFARVAAVETGVRVSAVPTQDSLRHILPLRQDAHCLKPVRVSTLLLSDPRGVSNKSIPFAKHRSCLLSVDKALRLTVVPMGLVDESCRMRWLGCHKGCNLALSCRGFLFSWGAPEVCILGHVGSPSCVPTRISSFVGYSVSVTQVSVGQAHVVVLSSNSRVFQWGCVHCNLGCKDFRDVVLRRPVLVEGHLRQLSPLAEARAGSHDTIVRSSAGSVVAWQALVDGGEGSRMSPALYQFRSLRASAGVQVLWSPTIQAVVAQKLLPPSAAALRPRTSFAQFTSTVARKVGRTRQPSSSSSISPSRSPAPASEPTAKTRRPSKPVRPQRAAGTQQQRAQSSPSRQKVASSSALNRGLKQTFGDAEHLSPDKGAAAAQRARNAGSASALPHSAGDSQAPAHESGVVSSQHRRTAAIGAQGMDRTPPSQHRLSPAMSLSELGTNAGTSTLCAAKWLVAGGQPAAASERSPAGDAVHPFLRGDVFDLDELRADRSALRTVTVELLRSVVSSRSCSSVAQP
mmetsp:Transcript_26973/g.60904  ORF Transcript_26973/g.60904 Transcript_26973/m.60904 type:complete len:612 (-) Transcript_26973:20-1855(-)